MAQDSNRSPGLLGYRPFLLCGVQDVSGFLQKNILTPLKFTKEDIVDILPTTGVRLLYRTSHESSSWMLNYFWFDGEGSLDTERLGQSFSELINNHDILHEKSSKS